MTLHCYFSLPFTTPSGLVCRAQIIPKRPPRNRTNTLLSFEGKKHSGELIRLSKIRPAFGINPNVSSRLSAESRFKRRFHVRLESLSVMAPNTSSSINSTNDQVKDTWSAELYNKNASFVYSPAYTSAVLSLLEAKRGERILDIGCGSGDITVDLQKVVGEDGVVVGTDFSRDMIEKSKANGLEHAFVADAQALQFPSDLQQYNGTFDAVFTNAALHWCKRDPVGVIKSAKAALKAGEGRFVGEFGGYLNCVGIRGAIHTVLRNRGYDPEKLDPWYFPSTQDYQSLLESEGFEVKHISLNPRITPLPGDLVGWQRTFCRESCFANMNDQEAEEAMKEVQNLCTVDCRDESGRWAIMYVRLRFVAVLPK